MKGVWVPSPVRELGSHMPHSMANRFFLKKRERKQLTHWWPRANKGRCEFCRFLEHTFFWRQKNQLNDIGSQILGKCFRDVDACSIPHDSVAFDWNFFFVHWDESESHSVVPDSLQPHELYSPWNSPGQNIGVGNLSLLQGIFLSQGLNPGLPHCRRILYQLNHKRSPLKWNLSPHNSHLLGFSGGASG